MEKKLKSVISTNIKNYPKDQEIWVEFYNDVPIGVADKINDSLLSDMEKSLILMESVIADWNFADSNNNFLEVNKDNIKRLGTDIARWIMEEATQIIKPDQVKKKD